MTEKTLDTELFGRKVSMEYSDAMLGYAIVGLRVVMGWVFLQAGLTKLIDPTWTAAGFLANTPEGNPFTSIWLGMAGNPLVDALNMWGLTLVGLGLLLGVLVRFSAFSGALIMLMYWAASLEGGLVAGLPLAHGWVVDDHIVYAVLLFGLGAFGAGRILGLDAKIEQTSVVKDNQWLKYLLG